MATNTPPPNKPPPRVPPTTDTSTGGESASEGALQKGVLISQIFAAVAVPFVLAVAGFFVQKAIQGETINRDYVNLAITLLTPKKAEDPQTSPELKKWAVRLLNESSPVKLTAAEIQSIEKEGLPKFAFGRNTDSDNYTWKLSKEYDFFIGPKAEELRKFLEKYPIKDPLKDPK